MEFELVILAQFIAFLVVSTGTIFAASAPRTGVLVNERRHRQEYVDRMGR